MASDLHMHTNFSDGKLSPEGNQFLIDKHKARGVRDTKELMEFIGQPEYE